MQNELVRIENIVRSFPIAGGILGRAVAHVHAVRGVSLSIAGGETLGLVGESGSGKTTLGHLMLKLTDPDSGEIYFDDDRITDLSESELRPLRKKMQIVFQDPYSSLNPRMTVGDILSEPFIVHNVGTRGDRKDMTLELLKDVGLPPSAFFKYPHEFSGGQRQRIGIARAIALKPKFIVADEPVSALDLSVRGEILNLIMELGEKFSLTYLFITHDLNIVEMIAHRVAVMYLGKIMEIFPAPKLKEARHPYTRALVASIPQPDPQIERKKALISGDVPSPIDPPKGCPFCPRCPYAKDICREKEPVFLEYATGLFAACHFIDRMNDM